MDASPQIAPPVEQFARISADIELCYETFGEPTAEPLLLVMGLAGPMTWWDVEFCESLAEKGFFVIRYDNRDMGHSSRMKGRVDRAQLVKAFLGRRVEIPYSLRDVAADGIGLLDHLGLDDAHVVGVSMGGMIVQSMAIDHPQRIRSVSSIMSTTGNRRVGWQDPRLFPRMLARRQTEREAYVATSAAFWRYIGSPGFPEDEGYLHAKAGLTWDRGISASGIMRQMLAILTQRDRTPELRKLTMPFLVVHGRQDKMVHPSGGRATASAVPGSKLVEIDGMGHNLPPQLWPRLIDEIRGVADRAASNQD